MKLESKVLTSIFSLMLLFNLLHASKDSTTTEKTKLYLCLNSCAMCVEHWEPGLYNGPRCAKMCMKHKGQKIVDPDCVKLKMFNYEPEVLKEHRKFIRQQNTNDSGDE
ncbi:hypothetical protein X975_13520, partial [Stegodyphus mimosarum]